MRNPLANEDAAFRLVLGTIAYLAPIVLASWIATWLGVVVFLAATVAAVVVLRGGRASEPAVPDTVARAAVTDTRRILVIADETLGSPRLQDAIVRIADGVAEDVLVICPVTSARSLSASAGEERLREAVAALRAAGVEARGSLGDADPVAALEAALQEFAADEIVISTHAAGHSDWLEQGVVASAAARFDGPVTHVVV
jgi:hypothetical protein